MGITQQIEVYENTVIGFLGWKYEGLKWCELGNQGSHRGISGKEVYEAYGVHHISMDLNGKDGSLMIDLNQAVPDRFVNYFDVITNYGTIEHIGNQCRVFKNVHDMCKKGGIMIHVFPMIGHWPFHGRYHYSGEFVLEFANACNYRMIEYAVLNCLFYKGLKNAIITVFFKGASERFIKEETFNQIAGIQDTGYLAHTGNYTKKEKAK